MNNSSEEKKETKDSEYAYKTVMDGKQASRIWSLISLIMAVLSVCLCFIPWAGLVLGLLAVVFSVVSRNNLGYFDNLGLVGLIVGIFGVVFGIGAFALEYIIDSVNFIFV